MQKQGNSEMYVCDYSNKQLCKFMMLKVMLLSTLLLRIIHTQKVLLVSNYRKMTNNAECNKYL